MEGLLREISDYVALAVETAAVLVVAFSSFEALVRTLVPLIGGRADVEAFKRVWSRFGRWLLLALQFALAADIVRSAISPSWEDIGHLAAIAAIRTFLSYFLEKDMEEIARSEVA